MNRQRKRTGANPHAAKATNSSIATNERKVIMDTDRLLEMSNFALNLAKESKTPGSTRRTAIALPLPVLDVRYLAALPDMLGVSLEDIEAVVYGGSEMVTESGSKQYPIGTVLTQQQFYEALDAGADIEVKYGAAAIEALANAKDVDMTDIVLRHVAILSSYIPEYSICFFYRGIARCSKKLREYLEDDAPDVVIRSEYKTLQKYVDGYFDNGLHRRAFLDEFGEPYDSRQTIIHHLLNKEQALREDNWTVDMFDKIDTTRLQEIREEAERLHLAIYNATEDEIDEACEQGGKGLDALYAEVKDMARDTISKVIKDRYSDLTESHDELLDAGLRSLLRAVDNSIYHFGPEDGDTTAETYEDMFFLGVIPNMDLTARHIRQRGRQQEERKKLS